MNDNERPAWRDDHFGNCPECGRTNGCLSVGPDHWYYCRIHRTKWCVGTNLFSGWRDLSGEDWARNYAILSDCDEVNPVFPSPEDPWEALDYIGNRLGGNVRVLDGLEAAVTAFALPKPTLEQAVVARFLGALLDQLSDRQHTPTTRLEIEGATACPF